MHIYFECTGGFTNLHLKYNVDTDELPNKLSEEILGFVKSAKFFEINPSDVLPIPTGPPDVIHYNLTITEGKNKNSITCTDFTAPSSLHPLLAILYKQALLQRRER